MHKMVQNICDEHGMIEEKTVISNSSDILRSFLGMSF